MDPSTLESARAGLAGLLSPGERVFIPGSSGEPMGLMDALYAAPERTRDLAITTTFVPGINPLRVDALHPSARVTGLFMQPGLRAAQASGRFRHLPLSYAACVRELERHAGFDVCVIQVSPPDAQGRCSLGPLAEFVPAALRRSRRLAAVINRQTPFFVNAPMVALAAFHHVVEVDAPLRTYEPGADDATAAEIARNVAAFVEDGASLQIGLGKVPGALMARLHDRRHLRLHSGLLSDGVVRLVEAGALDRKWRHVACALVGCAHLYAWAAEQPEIHVLGCEETHSPQRLAGLERFIAVHAALEVDLFGQSNLEFASGHVISGPGGAPDFARAAMVSRGGVSIVALPSTARSGSRIVPRLSSGVATLSRSDVGVFVTEHGAADMRGASVHERAERLIAIAAPEHRAWLMQQWKTIAAEL